MIATIGFIPTTVKNSTQKVKEKELIVPMTYTHSCAIGQTGCGKTTSYIYPNMNNRIEAKNSLLVMDYKGKEHNAVKLLAKRHNRLDDVVEIGKPWGESINIIKYMNEATLENFISGILGLSDGKNDYWSTTGTNLAIACINIIGSLENLINSIKVLKNSEGIFKACFKTNILEDSDDLGYLKGIPTVRNLKSVYEVSASFETIKLFITNINTICTHIEKGLTDSILYYDADMNHLEIKNKYKDVLENLCILEDNIKKYNPILKTFSEDKINSNIISILNALNKPLAGLATKEYLNNDNFNLVDALNNSKIVIINTQELSEVILSNYCYSIFIELQKRITKNISNGVSVFIDEAQRVVSKTLDIPIDVLREAKVELFLSFQNQDLMIEKLGDSKYSSLYKNLAFRYLFRNNEMGLSKLKSFQYFDLSKMKNEKIRTSIPLFLDDKELFEVEKEYQTKLNLHSKYGIDKKYSNTILVADSYLFSRYQVLLKDINNSNFIVDISKDIDKEYFNKILNTIKFKIKNDKKRKMKREKEKEKMSDEEWKKKFQEDKDNLLSWFRNKLEN
ncbi:type IV secretory system conjugative DNA transfer family protein [Aliarcobacter skirrowii]|uniref:hypothetical protein n=1 Tax=Aliarcobacter skirrowii TaxID=28200 RepID=UPI0021B4410D|nr:hypothetical protein [Aliarcobacter skirrowii]MCT7447147.1 hypothetical protein [Aliarcobacter skirrowii]